MTETPVIGFDPSTVNIFKKKVAFDIGWDELDGKKVNPHIDVPKFYIGGLGFQLAVESEDEEEFPFPHSIWLKMVQTSQKILLPDFEIQVTYAYAVVNGKGVKEADHNGQRRLGDTGCLLFRFRSVIHMEIDLEMDFRVVFSYRLSFLVPEVATKNENECKIILKDDENKTVYVNKHILASRSPFFKILFFGDFKEKDQDEVELSDVKQEDLLVYLSCAYPPPNTPFEFKTLRTLLILVDRFQNNLLMMSTKKFLTEKKDKTPEELRQTLILADEFNMTKLFQSTLKIMNKKDLKMLKPKTFLNFKKDNADLFVTHIHGLM